MAYVKEYWIDKGKRYWIDKKERAKKALRHTQEMYDKYLKEISYSVAHTIRYDEAFSKELPLVKTSNNLIVSIEANDVVSSVFKHSFDYKTAILNFSSYKNPGGMFLKGSKAQEECICHESFLYNVLKEKQKEFYDENKKHLNKALYFNRALYSPGIVFERKDKTTKAGVITCAAPNKSAAQNYYSVSDEENLNALKSRIKYIFHIAEDNDIECLILGAYGCGVFGQNPQEVAEIFKETINLYKSSRCLKKIIFAIPKGKDNNLKTFQKCLKTT